MSDALAAQVTRPDRVELAAMHAERVRMLMGSSLYIIVTAHLCCATILLVGLGWFSPHPALWPWWSAVVAITVVRALAIIRWRRVGIHPERAPIIARQFAALALTAGIVWGVGAVVLFDPQNIVATALLCVILAGMATGGMAPLAASFPAYALFATATLLPMTVFLFLYDVGVLWFLGASGIVLLISCLAAASFLNRRIRESIALRFENRQLIADLESRRREAERESEAKGRFLAAASHDLRQPLNSLSLAVDMLEAETDHGAREDIVRSIRGAVDATNDLLTGLLDVSRLDAGVVKPEPRPMALAPLLEHLAEIFGPLAQQRNIDLRVRPTNARVDSDPRLMSSVLQNLIGNAIRYGRENGRVLVAVRRRGTRWRIEVRDNGPGIAIADQESVFEDFMRGPDTEPLAGLGLGLGIVRRVVNLLGHDIRLNSALGQGSTFAVELEACEYSAHALPGVLARDEDQLDIAPADIEGLNVLLLASGRQTARQLKSLLGSAGMHVLAAYQADDAWDLADHGEIRPAVVIVEGGGGDETAGRESVQHITARLGSDSPVILITGDTSSQMARWADGAQVTLLLKPVTRASLFGAILKVTARDA